MKYKFTTLYRLQIYNIEFNYLRVVDDVKFVVTD